MAKYKIRTRQFCALSREQRWQSWLQSVSPELCDDLMKHLESNNTCRSNHNKMVEIQKKLEQKNLLPAMVIFLKKEYPFTVEKIEEQEKKISHKKEIKSAKADGMVFSYYNPHLLTFPQKMIIENQNQEDLEREIKEFIMNKVGVDYIIIGSRAYIEYFKLKYSKESQKVPQDSREIHLYRMKNGLSPLERSIQK